ncbi:protein ZAR1-like [Indicator indicator]|uniref:protein ZAR1-like n=1 Tax=Indicator indicator TaxID=1002788 RepID=UPI0023DF7E59|nr:protein ZAR1-like [Indicator indicator]
MESFGYHPFGMYQSLRGSLTPSRSRDPTVKQPSWKQSKSSGISPFLGGPFAPRPSDYLDRYRQSQLQALLSQVSPRLPPWLHRASTKEVGVQVSLRADAAVQCSLGPRTLPVGRPSALGPRWHLAFYSPVADGRLFALPEATGSQKDKASETTPEKQKEEDGSGEQQDGQAEAAVPSEETSEKPRENVVDARRRNPFQFLEQKYGYFHCKDCKTRWESAYVWCISGSNKVYFKQLCRKCQKGFNPYRVEAIQCQTCSKTRCSCPQKKRHIDLKRPHRQELCGRCKGKTLSCDSTYSFKYVV